MRVDPTTSTVLIDDRRFPAACAICPPHDERDDDDVDRMLAGPSQVRVGPEAGRRGYQVMIPCENGLLVVVDRWDDRPGLTLALYALTCEETRYESDGPLWLPWLVGLFHGDLVPTAERPPAWLPPSRSLPTWEWRDADEDWAVEFIDRVSVKPFVQPPGPRMRLVPLAEAERLLSTYRPTKGESGDRHL